MQEGIVGGMIDFRHELPKEILGQFSPIDEGLQRLETGRGGEVVRTLT